MKTIHKKMVTDERMRPVAVQIDYEDWLEIERELGLTDAGPSITDLSRYSGILKLSEEPLKYQEQVRGEWS